MNNGYFDDSLNLYNSIVRRKRIVQDELSRLGDNCKEDVDVPCCLLHAELEVLTKYSEVLERELWYKTKGLHDLVSTVEGMVSSDWKERLKAEWAQLCIRMEKLDNFRDSFRNDNIDFKPKWDERLLCDQLRAMRMYRDILRVYARIEGVDLDTSLYDDSYIYDYYFNKDKTDEDQVDKQ